MGYTASLHNFWLLLGEELDNTCTVAEYEDYNQESLQLDFKAEAFDAQAEKESGYKLKGSSKTRL